MTGKKPNKDNNYYIVGGQLNANDRNNSIEMPPKSSRNCKSAVIALNSGDFITIEAKDNIVIKNKNGVISTRKDGKDGKGKILTQKDKNISRDSNHSFDEI